MPADLIDRGLVRGSTRVLVCGLVRGHVRELLGAFSGDKPRD